VESAATNGLAKSAGTTTSKGASTATEPGVVHLALGVSVQKHISLMIEAVNQPTKQFNVQSAYYGSAVHRCVFCYSRERLAC
jgi:hypothetical protein